MNWFRLVVLIGIPSSPRSRDLTALDRVIVALADADHRLALNNSPQRIGFKRSLVLDWANVGEPVTEQITITNHREPQALDRGA